MQSKNLLFCTISALGLFLSYSVFFFINDIQKIKFLAREDGMFETIGAIFFLIAGLLFFIIFLKSRKNNNKLSIRNIFFLLLSCAFLFAFLEEISWGQRIFNLTTPELIEEINQQKEINIHNLKWFHGLKDEGEKKNFLALFLNFDRVFALFWFSYCCILPLLYKINGQINKIVNKLNFPIVPLFIGIFFIINYILSILFSSYINPLLQHSLIEIKESNFALLFFIVSLYFIKDDTNYNHRS